MSSTPAATYLLPRAGAALALAALVVLVADAAARFSRLPPGTTATIAALAALGLIVLAVGRSTARVARGGARAVLAILLGALLALAGNSLVRRARLAALPARAERQAAGEIERRAALIQAEFAALLDRSAGPLDTAREGLPRFAGGPAQAFDLIERIDSATGFTARGGGLSFHELGGRVVAWAGDSYPTPPSLLEGLPEGRVIFRMLAEEHLARLYGLLRSGGHVLVSEMTVASRLDPRVRDRAFPVLAGDDAVILRLQDFREPETGFADLLARKDDRYPGGAAGERKLLFVGLRAADRSFVGYARLRGPGPSDMRRRLDGQHRDAAALLLALTLVPLSIACFYPAREPAPSATGPAVLLARLAGRLGLIWGGRAMLSWFPPGLASGELDLFDSSLFASAGLFHLLRSPGELLLTALAALASCLLMARACGRLAPRLASSTRSGLASVAGAFLLIALAAGAVFSMPALARELVRNSALNLLVVEPLSPSPPTLAVQASALLLMLSVLLLAQAALLIAGAAGSLPGRLARFVPRPGEGLKRWALGTFVPGMALAALLYDPLIAPPVNGANEALFEDQLMPLVLHQSENRRSIVRATIESLEAMPDLPDRIATAAEPALSSMALDLWLRTPLKDSGYNASLLIVGPDGRPLSRFARNLPPAFDSRAPERAQAPPGQPVLERISFLNLTKRIWHADQPVYLGAQFVGTVTVHMVDDFDNIPFLSAERPYARALTPQARRVTTLPAGSRGVRHAVYDPHGKPLFWNQREAPHLPRDWTNLLVSPGAVAWSSLREDGRPARYLFFSDGDHLFSLGFAASTPMERVARAFRMTFLGLMVVGALLLPAALIQARGRVRGWWPRLLSALGRTHYRKVLGAFTAAALIPLVALAALVTGYITAEIDRDIEDRGQQGIRSASSLVKTILDTEETAKPDDDTLYWLSLLVGEDVNLYERGELVATSRPELFSSGLVSPRIDGRIYRMLALEGKRFAMGEEEIRGYEYRTITAAVVANDGRWEGLLSLPLDAQTAEALMAAREVADAMIITFTGMVLLMGGVGYVLARRVSRPIRSLGTAAARIAAGDFDAVVEERPRDETGELIASFNQMARALKEQREDLQRRKDYIEKILLNATIGVISMDRSGRVVTVNPAAGSILDLPDLAGGADIVDLVSANPPLRPLAGLLRDPAAFSSRDVELALPGPPPGRTVRARAVTFLEGEAVILLLEDVTETVRSNRLAAWAEMARRIAHEIKNPLTPIQLSTEHIRRVHAEDSPDFPVVLEECLRTIMEAVASLRQISAEFSTYARIPVPQKEPTDMSALIEEVARPYRAAMPAGVRLQLDVPPGLPSVSVDRSLIGRALINLIENSLQAMPLGGTLSIAARSAAERLEVEVADSGVGMDAVALGRIFEPYFSTKDAGTGLGLAIARKAVEEHGGRIEVASAPGEGTRMTIVLPVSPGPPTAPVAVERAARRPRD